ncbi:hypothetical protein SDC9_177753 [bioreactor metagenome]|uniref:Uncharacterized protein n=1 Tax=bioreactor metagenome TaxID=1076179 RepID=A0A645GVC7_9ZZZZ
MVLKVDVPIVVSFLDYKKKEIGVKGAIENLDNKREVMQRLSLMYKDVAAKCPEKFSLELKN